MRDMSSLQQAVEAAQAAYARASEHHRRASKHILSLIDIVEGQLRDVRLELSHNESERARMVHDYARLGQMLRELVTAAQAGAPEPLGSLPSAPLAGPEPEASLGPVHLDPAANDAAPSSHDGHAPAGDGEPAGPGELRAGLKRVLKKARPGPPPGEAPEDPAPAE